MLRGCLGACMQLREAEESGLVLRSAMAASAPLGLLAFACGSFVGILDLPMFAAEASGDYPSFTSSPSSLVLWRIRGFSKCSPPGMGVSHEPLIGLHVYGKVSLGSWHDGQAL